MQPDKEEIICNRFEQVLGHWICLHDETIHFPNHDDPNYMCIKLCTQTLRIRANDAWSKLPQHLKEATVAHEIGHLEMNHASQPSNGIFGRIACVMEGSVDSKELEADRYACKLVGREKYVNALKELIARSRAAGRPALSTHELELREKEIQKQLQN